jgi:hypothetical protein
LQLTVNETADVKPVSRQPYTLIQSHLFGSRFPRSWVASQPFLRPVWEGRRSPFPLPLLLPLRAGVEVELVELGAATAAYDGACGAVES